MNNHYKSEIKWQLERRKSAVNVTIGHRAIQKTSNRRHQQAKALRRGAGWSAERKRQPIHVKLADENIAIHTEDSQSAYDSLNEASTDICCDEEDTVSVSDDTDVNEEYELDFTSSSEDLFSGDGSSGTEAEEIVLMYSMAEFDSSSSSVLDDDADTEESDDSDMDPELGPADYWTCIKCGAQNNTPLYRYCEKCFQTRKTHYPPRPKHSKKRQAKLKDRNDNEQKATSTDSALSDTDDKTDGQSSQKSNDNDVDAFGKFINNSSSSSKRSRASARGNSAGDSSCCSSQEFSPDEQQSPTSPHTTLVTTPHSNYLLDACASSQETYCSQIEQCVDPNANINLTQFSQDSLYPQSTQLSTQVPTQFSTQSVSATSSSSSLGDLMSSMARPVEKSSSLSSGEFAPALTHNLNVPDYTLKNFARELHEKVNSNNSNIDCTAAAIPVVTSSFSSGYGSSGAVTGGSTKKLKKRKHSMADRVDDMDLIVKTPKKLKPQPSEEMASPSTSVTDLESTIGMCTICFTHPKDTAFVHNRSAHVSCCYPCASKAWNKLKRCPVCNLQAKTFVRIYFH